MAVLGGVLPAIWTALPARVFGTVVVALPLIIASRLRMTRSAFPLVGIAEVLGVVSLALGARDGIAVASVMGSQFAAIAGIAAMVLIGERVTRSQAFGIAMIAVGVASLTILRA